MALEKVYTIWDFYDGPRTGIAAYCGMPHYYYCEWDDAADDYSTIYTLLPLDDQTFQLAVEQWSLWQEWETNFHAGKVSAESHPGFGGKNARYDELQKRIKERLACITSAPLFAIPNFCIAPDSITTQPGVVRQQMVAWENVI
jgi:hypothetical protein